MNTQSFIVIKALLINRNLLWINYINIIVDLNIRQAYQQHYLQILTLPNVLLFINFGLTKDNVQQPYIIMYY